MRQSDKTEAVVRALRVADVTALVDLWAASWREAMPAIDFEARRAWIADVLHCPEYETLVVERGGAPVGFATLEGRHLHQLVVASAAKGRDCARVLLDAAKARTPNGIVLDVNEANTRAIRFYAREGFRRVGAGTNPTSGLPTLRMRWP